MRAVRNYVSCLEEGSCNVVGSFASGATVGRCLPGMSAGRLQPEVDVPTTVCRCTAQLHTEAWLRPEVASASPRRMH